MNQICISFPFSSLDSILLKKSLKKCKEKSFTLSDKAKNNGTHYIKYERFPVNCVFCRWKRRKKPRTFFSSSFVLGSERRGIV